MATLAHPHRGLPCPGAVDGLGQRGDSCMQRVCSVCAACVQRVCSVCAACVQGICAPSTGLSSRAIARTTLPTGTQSLGKYEGSAMTSLVFATTSCTLMPHATPPSYSTCGGVVRPVHMVDRVAEHMVDYMVRCVGRARHRRTRSRTPPPEQWNRGEQAALWLWRGARGGDVRSSGPKTGPPLRRSSTMHMQKWHAACSSP